MSRNSYSSAVSPILISYVLVYDLKKLKDETANCKLGVAGTTERCLKLNLLGVDGAYWALFEHAKFCWNLPCVVQTFLALLEPNEC